MLTALLKKHVLIFVKKGINCVKVNVTYLERGLDLQIQCVVKGHNFIFWCRSFRSRRALKESREFVDRHSE